MPSGWARRASVHLLGHARLEHVRVVVLRGRADVEVGAILDLARRVSGVLLRVHARDKAGIRGGRVCEVALTALGARVVALAHGVPLALFTRLLLGVRINRLEEVVNVRSAGAIAPGSLAFVPGARVEVPPRAANGRRKVPVATLQAELAVQVRVREEAVLDELSSAEHLLYREHACVSCWLLRRGAVSAFSRSLSSMSSRLSSAVPRFGRDSANGVTGYAYAVACACHNVTRLSSRLKLFAFGFVPYTVAAPG
jgi:hypothetical protein